jgi:hypothetical protein
LQQPLQLDPQRLFEVPPVVSLLLVLPGQMLLLLVLLTLLRTLCHRLAYQLRHILAVLHLLFE